MVPIYSIDSYLAIRFTDYAIYFDTLREWYEAYAIYNFMALVMRYLQRNYDMRYILEYKGTGTNKIRSSYHLKA